MRTENRSNMGNRRAGNFSHRNIKRKKIMRNHLMKVSFIITIAMLFIIAIGRLMIVNASDEGQKKENQIRYYTSISIESDETLWHIAEEYNNGEESNKHYINSIMELNNMSVDTLYSGQNLLVYYFSSEVKE